MPLTDVPVSRELLRRATEVSGKRRPLNEREVKEVGAEVVDEALREYLEKREGR